ncbi:MAG: thymidine phosphorylase [Actinomycetes bacterium]
MSALIQEIIAVKRDGGVIPDVDIEAFIAGVADGSVPDYQSAAMLMAIYIRGLTDHELAIWTNAMLYSGDVIERGSFGRPAVDKHSTGGVGDKVSLPLGPAAAACGLAVPMISGRGLGHTGGTLDKLEAIPGFRVELTSDDFINQVRTVGIAIVGQTERLVPADRVLYALRDTTGTVASIPLIASSIMSKKLAEGIDALILDLKVGEAAFMRTAQDGHALAAAMQTIGSAAGTPVTVALTHMDAPIGTMVGNAVEIVETIDVLKGGGPADTRELVVELGAEMLSAAGISNGPDDARTRIAASLADGSALDVFTQMVAAQGGDPRVVDDPWGVMTTAPHRVEVLSPRSGVISEIDATGIGIGALELGGGRRQKTDVLDHSVGVQMLHTVGDRVAEGEVLAIMHTADRGVEGAKQRILDAFVVTDESAPESPTSRIIEILRSA